MMLEDSTFVSVMDNFYHQAGAKGKFSGGFDITAFGGVQGGSSMFNSCLKLTSF